jgi:hypothetical protein
MTPSTVTIPVNVTPDAAARLAELGLQAEVEQMINHAQDHLPDVVRIEVMLNERADPGIQFGISVEAYGTRPFNPSDHITGDLARWQVATFAPMVLEHLNLCYLRGGAECSAPHQMD